MPLSDDGMDYQGFEYVERDREHEMQSLSMGFRCSCGHGYCHVHGTFHYDERFEIVQIINTHRQSPMGQRAIRKPRMYE